MSNIRNDILQLKHDNANDDLITSSSILVSKGHKTAFR